LSLIKLCDDWALKNSWEENTLCRNMSATHTMALISRFLGHHVVCRGWNASASSDRAICANFSKDHFSGFATR
jgi:hypothetical protein